MSVESACRASPRSDVTRSGATRDRATSPFAAHSRRRPNCPACGRLLLIAEESRFNASGRINHDWSCDGCGHHFATAVRLGRRST
jgi:ribosomal protein L37AE/L43A